jgi:hypothetical protein
MTLSPAELKQRRVAALEHGGHSTARIRPLARAQRQRLLRLLGCRAADLDPIGRGLLGNWARAAAVLSLLDRYAAQHGFLDEDGEPRPFTRIYFTALNSERLAISRLADHLKARGTEPSIVAVLQTNARRLDGDGREAP